MRCLRVPLALLWLAACTNPPPPAPPPTPSANIPAPPPKRAGATLPAAVTSASESGKTDPDCVGNFTLHGDEADLKIAGHTYRRAGATLSLVDPPPETGLVLGVIANLKEPTGANLFNLKRYLAQFSAAKVSAILVAGDSGETKAEIAGTLAPLVKTGLPVLVIPGNREDKDDYHAAIAGLAAPNLIDMTRIRLVKLRDASVVSLPGYYDKRYMYHPDSECLYTKEDVYRLEPIVKEAQGPAILLAHAEPHGTGPQALDAFQGGNAGDANLTDFLKTRNVPFGVFANIQEAGGHATDLDSNEIAEGGAHDHLFLNPGLADATPWQLNDGRTSHGSIAILTIKDGKASYQIYRAPPLTDAESAEAGKLAPKEATAH